MIVLHGRGDSLRPFRNFDKELKIPGMNYLLLNAPRKYLSGFTWYAFPPNQQLGIYEARKKLNILMEELIMQGWKPEDVFFFGFSQGCLVSCDFAMNYEHRLGGVIGVSGYVYFFKNWKKNLKLGSMQTPVLLTHGLRDQDLPLAETKSHYEKLKNIGLNIDWLEVDKDHEIDDEMEIPLIRDWIYLCSDQKKSVFKGKTL